MKKEQSVKEYDLVSLPDGRIGHVIEIFGGGKDVLVEFETPDGPDMYDDALFRASEVKPVSDETRS